MFKSLTVQFTYIKNVFTVNDLPIYCNLSRRAISKEFDMLKAKFLSHERYFLEVYINPFKSSSWKRLLHCPTIQIVRV